MKNRINRREFIRRSAITSVGLSFASPLLQGVTFARGLRGQGGGSDKVIVTVNLFGGNDYLNTVIPIGQYDRYRELRPQLGLERDRVLALAGITDFGLNPGMTAFQSLFASGRLAIVNGVGVPRDADGLFNHELSQYLFQSGASTDPALTTTRTGWLGRYLDTVGEGIISPGINLGGGQVVLAGLERDALAIGSIGDLQIRISDDRDARLDAYTRIMQLPDTDTAGEYNREVRKRALDQTATIQERTNAYEPAVEYPDNNSLADSLRQCASLVWSDLGVRAVCVGYDGFDTHASQNDGAGPNELGNHDYSLMSVSEAIAAFQADLEAQGVADRVLTVVFSEFGRRPEENADIGTDHGYANAMFVVGTGVRGGAYGDYPSIAEDRLVLDGNVDATVDLRSVYATLLGGFLDTDPAPVLGGQFPQLGFLV